MAMLTTPLLRDVFSVPAGVAALAASMHTTAGLGLTSLDLGANTRVGEVGWRALARCVQASTSLTKLSLKGCELGQAAAPHLAHLLRSCPTLSELDLSGTKGLCGGGSAMHSQAKGPSPAGAGSTAGQPRSTGSNSSTGPNSTGHSSAGHRSTPAMQGSPSHGALAGAGGPSRQRQASSTWPLVAVLETLHVGACTWLRRLRLASCMVGLPHCCTR